MGVAFGRLVARKEWVGAGLFFAQFILNLAWTPLFFGAHYMATALGIILFLWVGLAVTIGVAWERDRISGILLVPYLVWVTYATYLNAGFFVLNS